MDDQLPDLFPHDESLAYYKTTFGEEFYEETLSELWEHCVLESTRSIYIAIHKQVILNMLFGIVTSFGLPHNLYNGFSTLCGIYMLLTTLQTTGLTVVLSTFFLAYAVILLIKNVCPYRKIDNANQESYVSCLLIPSIVQYGLIVMFVLFEYLILEKDTWLEMRGTMMVFSMKFISLITDLPPSYLPSLLEYCGYIFCPGNILFGPWISFDHYMMQLKFPTRKNTLWVVGIAKALAYALLFLSVSNCWASYFISDESNRLVRGYKEALSFRTSHYFVCYLSEAFMLAAGWKDFKHHYNDEYWNFSITNVLKIEFPPSLAVVVVNWNKPMHEFLKKYIYRKWLPKGKFQAVFLTFLISSLFHGFELKVSTVLISLGIFSYLQILVRDHISQTFDICVKVHPCKSCQHRLKRDSAVSKITLVIFAIFTFLHLIFLGVLMDQSTDEVGIYQKWNDLYFYSLWIMFLDYLLIK